MRKRKLISLILILFIISTSISVGKKSFYSVRIAQSSNTELAMQNLTFHNYYLSNDDEIFSSEFIIHHSKVTELVNHINNDFRQNDTL